MKTLIITLLLATASVGYCDVHSEAQRMVNSEKNQPATKKAEADFKARCAANYQWRNATNQIGKTTAKITQLNNDSSKARERARLAHQAGQTRSPNSPEAIQISNQVAAEQKQVAALQLEKMKIEDQIRSMMPKPKP